MDKLLRELFLDGFIVVMNFVHIIVFKKRIIVAGNEISLKLSM
jgi:hypothetical protein